MSEHTTTTGRPLSTSKKKLSSSNNIESNLATSVVTKIPRRKSRDGGITFTPTTPISSPINSPIKPINTISKSSSSTSLPIVSGTTVNISKERPLHIDGEESLDNSRNSSARDSIRSSLDSSFREDASLSSGSTRSGTMTGDNYDYMDVSRNIRYGTYQPSKEEKYEQFSVYNSHRVHGLKNLASFGVFDGHKASFAADVCSKELHENFIENFVLMSQAILLIEEMKDTFPIDQKDKVDALLCQSMRRACANIDEYVRLQEEDSGTCALSLIIIRCEDGSSRVICSNLGDSRCILLGKLFKSVVYLNGGTTHSSYGSNLIRAYKMTEEHKISLLRERSRVLGKAREKNWQQRPDSVFIALPANIIAYESGLESGVCPTFELGYPSRERVNAANSLLAVLKQSSSIEFTPRRQQTEYVMIELESQRSEDGEEQFKSHTELVNGQRVNVRGPKATTTLRTTRSIGDKFGPEGLVAIPDFSAVTIMPNESGR